MKTGAYWRWSEGMVNSRPPGEVMELLTWANSGWAYLLDSARKILGPNWRASLSAVTKAWDATRVENYEGWQRDDFV